MPGQCSPQPRNIKLRSDQVASQMTKFCVIHRWVELDEDVSDPNALSILNMDRANHSGLERLDKLGAAAWHNLAGCNGNNIGRPE